MANTTAPITDRPTQSMLKVEHKITINMGEYGKVDTSLEEIAEKFKKDFYKHLNCPFSK